jgi:flagellar export protein FliJ
LFNFHFQILLDHQKRLEEKLQSDFSDCQRRLEKESLVLYEYKDEVEGHVKELQSQIQEGTRIEKVVLYKNYIQKTLDLIDQKRKSIFALEGELEKAKKALIQASTKRKVLEKLREKARASFTQKMEKAVRKFLDEVSIRRYITGSAGIDEKVIHDLATAGFKSQKDHPD